MIDLYAGARGVLFTPLDEDLGYIALEAVKAYARRLLADHARTQQGLIDEAHRAGLHPPAPALTGDLQRRLDALGDLPAADFDAAWLAAQAEVTRQALVTHQAYARDGDNAILRAVAEARGPEETRRLIEAEAEARPPGT